MPFPPTPEPAEVSEPGPLIKPNSYKDIKDSIYFREKMVKKKTTKKLTQKEKDDLQAGKQQRDPIPATPLRKSGRGNAAAQKEVDDTVEAGRKKLNLKSMPATGGVKKTAPLQTRNSGPPGN